MKKNIKILIAVVIAVIVVATAFAVLYHPPKVFTDTSQTAAPEQLDPATGFFTTNGPLFQSLYQTLVEYNGSSTKVVPVLASHVYNPNDKNYTFELRNYVNFSNKQQLNATSVWFSFYRGIIMGQGPYASDYPGILFNSTDSGMTGYSLPNGTIQALESAGYKIPKTTGTPGTSSYNSSLNATYKTATNDLASILSHFNYNATEMKVMHYNGQAIVVNSKFNVSINTIETYPYLLQDIAGWWGDIIEPSYVDAHGGVKPNTPNSYLDLNGPIGSGPYEISSVGKGFSTIVLKANPNYWVAGHSSVPSIAQAAHIKTIAIKYGLSHTSRQEDFDKNTSQISTIGPASFKSMINGFYNIGQRNTKLVKTFPEIGTFYISMNTQRSYTNNVTFRDALYNALNYTAELKAFNNNYNGTPEAYQELGPLSPIYGKAYYNPNNYSLPQQNLTRAEHNLTLYLDAHNEYVTLPNGHKLGVKTGTDLTSTKFKITYISPITAIGSAELTAAIDSFKQIGLTFISHGVTESTVSTWTNASSTPHFVDLGWLPDFPDAVGQQLIPVYDKSLGGAFGGNDAWVDNATLQKMFSTLDFQNKTTQEKKMYQVQNITQNLSAYMWVPMPNDVFFVQPYVHNFVFNSITSAYYYNIMTVSAKFSSSSSAYYLPLYNIIMSLEYAVTSIKIF